MALPIIGVLWGPTGCSKNWNRDNKQDTIPAKDISKTPLDTLIDQVENEDLKQSLLNLRKNPAKLNDSVNSHGDTVLILAARQQNNKALEALINLGADPNVANNSGKTAMHAAGFDLKALQALINAGANVNSQGLDGRTPLNDLIISILDSSSDDCSKIAAIKMIVENSGKGIKLEDIWRGTPLSNLRAYQKRAYAYNQDTRGYCYTKLKEDRAFVESNLAPYIGADNTLEDSEKRAIITSSQQPLGHIIGRGKVNDYLSNCVPRQLAASLAEDDFIDRINNNPLLNDQIKQELIRDTNQARLVKAVDKILGAGT